MDLLLANFGSVLSYVLYILLAILVLLVMITVHELGHYISGKIFGFKIDEFAIGFGPKIFSTTKKNGEKFSVRLLPLGGFCAFHGEDEEATDSDSFNAKKPWQRLIVLVSGALMNYLLAVVVIFISFSLFGTNSIMTYSVNKTNSFGDEYSFADKDIIISIDNKNIYLTTDLMAVLDGKSKGDEIFAEIIRNGKREKITVKLNADADFANLEDLDKLADVLNMNKVSQSDGTTDYGFRSTGIKLSFFKTLGRSFSYSFKIAGTIFVIIKQLLTGSLGIGSLGGTVTTIGVTASTIRSSGIWGLLSITSLIGVNLAVFNLIPFPALDGSRALFTIIEWIRRKPINRKVEGIVHTVGIVILLLFAFFIDFQRCFI